MRWTKPAALLLTAALSPLNAWHEAGHMTVAYIAYVNLSPRPKTRLAQLLRGHPDYQLWTKDLPAGADPILEAFLQSSIWPDVIRRDPRFYDESKPGATPTPPFPGVTDTQIHGRWHYKDIPLAGVPGAETPENEPPNALTETLRISRELNSGYNLSWLVHLVGDIHQPLHGAGRFSMANPDPATGKDRGDLGGNTFKVDHPVLKNLHAYWDGQIKMPATRSELYLQARAIAAELKPWQAVHLDMESWLQESFELSRDIVYSIGPEKAGQPPVRPTAAYEQQAGRIARERVALAGFRLASLLNDRLQ